MRWTSLSTIWPARIAFDLHNEYRFGQCQDAVLPSYDVTGLSSFQKQLSFGTMGKNSRVDRRTIYMQIFPSRSIWARSYCRTPSSSHPCPTPSAAAITLPYFDLLVIKSRWQTVRKAHLQAVSPLQTVLGLKHWVLIYHTNINASSPSWMVRNTPVWVTGHLTLQELQSLPDLSAKLPGDLRL